ncbi:MULTISPECIES: dUTP diphosphatase [unclassified Romboutsia]|uniref:dUTP diphosphatase n=1 Tax=unclassified Romboutsia TaxID=2626894 RepID=UPI0008228A02|nr:MULTISPECIES: dUTP diphosphatase [unclassified Romboutsia]SCH89863.1 Deoxyuridine 5'-triphosphate nucleotidohydrolase [uncultured Clostridium sp.]
MIMNVKKVSEDAVIPVFAHETDSGFDLFTCEEITVAGRKKAIAKTGLVFEIPYGWGIQIKNKSGITVKGVPTISGQNADITVFEGTVDMDYRGEVGIMLKNEEDFEITIPKHTKIAQGVLRKVYHCEFREVTDVNKTVRGEGGFGSTGTTV